MAKKTGYGLIALTHLARAEGCCVSARVIAGEYGVPLSLLMNVLKILSAGGYVQSYRGPRGGYSLVRPADQVTLAEVMETIEGPIRFVACATARGEADEDRCRLVARCPIHRTVCRLHKRMRQFLEGVTIADLAAEGMALPEPETIASGSAAVGYGDGKRLNISRP